MPDEAALIQRARHDPEAFTELYQRYLKQVFRFLLARVGNTQDAEDLTTQTFMAALQGIGRYQGQGTFAAWLMGIARRKAADHFRSHSPATLLLEETIDDAMPSVEEVAERNIQLDQVMQGIRHLTPERAEALTLRMFAGLSAAETGALMGKSEDAVHALVSRAMHDLREKLAGKVVL